MYKTHIINQMSNFFKFLLQSVMWLFNLGAMKIIHDTLKRVGGRNSVTDTGGSGGEHKYHMSFFVHFWTEYHCKSL